MVSDKQDSNEDKIRLEVEVPKDQLEAKDMATDGAGDKNNDNDSGRRDPMTQKKEDELQDRGKMTVGGYRAGEIAGSVSSPPTPEEEKPQAEQHRSSAKPTIVSRVLLIVGVGVIVLGFLAMLVDMTVAVSLWSIGVLIIIASFAIDKTTD